ncbi:MAG: DUF1990 domain-containing protein [Planctomycetota bacterium]|nr:DUF1990 domain-containing protein [Planctomycetota bacterium]
MLSFKRPTEADVIRYLLDRQESPFTYGQLGVTQTHEFPDRFDVDRQQTQLGTGEATYEIAKDAVRRWAMFPNELTELYWPDRPLRIGVEVAVLFRAGPLWSLNPCRIVYTIDDAQPSDRVHRFGFAYGTLAGHLECGEEQFCVSWNHDDDSVHYELLAVSRPNHLLTRIGYPYARFVQARFRRLSAQAMARFVRDACPVNCG